MYRSTLLTETCLLHATSSRDDGNMAFSWGEREDVMHNRRAFLEHLGTSLELFVALSLNHSTRISEVTRAVRGSGMRDPETSMAPCDAAITGERGVGLFLTTADCLPITFFDPQREVLALVHAGWRGVDARLPELVIEALTAMYSCDPKILLVNIGPCVHKESYVLPRDESLRRKKALDPHERWLPFVEEMPHEMLAVDLVAYARAQLCDAGVPESHIEITPIDTASSTAYFSHTRSKQTGEHEGRFATVAMMPA